MLVHLLGMEVCNQKGDVVAFDGLSAQDDEVFGSHHHEAGEFVTKDLLDLVGLLDGNTDSHGVHRGFDENSLLLVTRNNNRIQNELLRGLHLDFRLIVSFNDLKRKIQSPY